MPTPDKRGVIRALRKQEQAYRRVLRSVVDAPILAGFSEGLAGAAELAVAIEAGVLSAESRFLRELHPVSVQKLNAYFVQLSAEHRTQFIKRFTTMTSVDVSATLRQGPVAEALIKRVDANVDLIKLIAKEHLPKVAVHVQKALVDRPFDRLHLANYFRSEWRYRDYPLRRIARDQVNKSIGQFNEIRQTQLGIESYQWQSVGDNRTRPTHAANNGREFYWNDPPAQTGHPGEEIQCRCVAIPIIPDLIAK